MPKLTIKRAALLLKVSVSKLFYAIKSPAALQKKFKQIRNDRLKLESLTES